MFIIKLRSPHLKVLSALFINISAGLFLGLFAIRDFVVLTMNAIFAILYLIIAIKIEDILEEL